MNIFSLLSLLAFMVYMVLGLYPYHLNPKSRLNRLFLIVCFDLSWWAFAYSFVYSAPNKEVLWVWFKISAVGWCLFGGIALHFMLILSKKEEWLQKRWLYGLLYGPGLLFLYRAWTGVLTAKDFVQTPLGWVEVGAAESVWLWLHTFNYSACVLIGCVLVFQWGKQSKILREKKQARIIVGTMLTSFILGTIVNILLPASKWQTMPAFAPILILVWAYGIWQAMTHYWFMGLSPAMAAEEIMDRMKDLLILANPDGKIIKINRQTEKLLGYQEEELLMQPVERICRDEEVVREILLRVANNLFSLPDRKVEYLSKNGELIPVKISISIMKDNLNQAMGVVILGEDRRTTLRLRDEITVRRRAENALLKAHEELEIRIQERTEELFQSNTALQEEMAERKEAEELFKTLFRQSPIGIYIAQKGRIKLANPEFLKITGFSEAELSVFSLFNLVYPEDRENVRENGILMLKGRRHHPYEFRALTKDGHIRWILETVTSIRYLGSLATLGSFMDITSRKESEEKIHQLAYHDSLTGLPNRALFADRLNLALAQAQRNKEDLTLMMLDLDNFKMINDTFGHNWGDLLLQEVSRTLIGLLRKSDTVTRLGGDEFMILLPETGQEKDAGRIAGKILEVIGQPIYLGHQPVQITVSIGLAFYPKDGDTPESLMKNADLAMYQAKAKGRNNYQYYGLDQPEEAFKKVSARESGPIF